MKRAPILAGSARWRARRDHLEPAGPGRWVAAGSEGDPAYADDTDPVDLDTDTDTDAAPVTPRTVARLGGEDADG